MKPPRITVPPTQQTDDRQTTQISQDVANLAGQIGSVQIAQGTLLQNVVVPNGGVQVTVTHSFGRPALGYFLVRANPYNAVYDYPNPVGIDAQNQIALEFIQGGTVSLWVF